MNLPRRVPGLVGATLPSPTKGEANRAPSPNLGGHTVHAGDPCQRPLHGLHLGCQHGLPDPGDEQPGPGLQLKSLEPSRAKRYTTVGT